MDRRGMEERPGESAADHLAASHWSYIEGMLRVHGESESYIAIIGFHYKTAFIHGYKHAEEVLEQEPALPSLISKAISVIKDYTIYKGKKNA